MAEITIQDLRQRHIEDFLQARREIREGATSLDTQSYTDALVGFASTLAKQALEAEEFNAALSKYVEGLLTLEERRGDLTQAEMDGVIVRAAARCGWFDDLEEDDVADLYGWEVDETSTAVVEAFNDAMTMPKN